MSKSIGSILDRSEHWSNDVFIVVKNIGTLNLPLRYTDSLSKVKHP